MRLVPPKRPGLNMGVITGLTQSYYCVRWDEWDNWDDWDNDSELVAPMCLQLIPWVTPPTFSTVEEADAWLEVNKAAGAG